MSNLSIVKRFCAACALVVLTASALANDLATTGQAAQESLQNLLEASDQQRDCGMENLVAPFNGEKLAARDNPKCTYLEKCCAGNTDNKSKCCEGVAKHCGRDGGTN